RRGFLTLQRVAWALFWLCLPITSFRYFPSGLGGGTLVRPLSLYPLLFLLPIATLPRLSRRPQPKTVLTLIPFAVVVLISAANSFLLGIEPVLGISVSERVLRALITLAIGLSFYLTVAVLPEASQELRSALRWMMFGFVLAFLWGSLQTIYILHFNGSYFSLLNQIQKAFSLRKLFPTRISGATYEPNWFAEQINLLVIPWLLAAIINKRSLFPWRWRQVSIEWLLLGWAIFLIAFTFSRAGYVNLAVLALGALILFRLRQFSQRGFSLPKVVGRLVLESAAVLILFVGMTFVVGQKNDFFARIWTYWIEVKDTSFERFLYYIGFNARMTYSATAFNTFQAYPLLGVGPGNYAFFFEKMLPDQPLAPTPELLRIISPEEGQTRLITPKNLFLRILAENGLLGFGAFLVFLIANLGNALYLWLSPHQEEQFWGTAALLGLLGLAVAAFSFDSFALPNMWVLLGLITAACKVSVNNSVKNT
ncbi:MAG: O-antigen ligase family protein, partial [Anaerolineales bacterium]|nr:O-antigen ligase family protein [Anaerolineales bacterium]